MSFFPRFLPVLGLIIYFLSITVCYVISQVVAVNHLISSSDHLLFGDPLFDSHNSEIFVWLIFFISTVVNFLFTISVSPGYVDEDVLRRYHRTGQYEYSSYGTVNVRHYHDTCAIMGGGDGNIEPEREVRFCKHCREEKPARAHHCRECARCVLELDHHCTLIGTCIAWRNYKFFLLLLMYSSGCSWVMLHGLFQRSTGVWVVMHDLHAEFWKNGNSDFTNLINGNYTSLQRFSFYTYVTMKMVSYSFLVFTIVLTFFTLFHLIIRLFFGMTTLEFCEKRHKEKHQLSMLQFKNRSFMENVRRTFGPYACLWFLPVNLIDPKFAAGERGQGNSYNNSYCHNTNFNGGRSQFASESSHWYIETKEYPANSGRCHDYGKNERYTITRKASRKNRDTRNTSRSKRSGKKRDAVNEYDDPTMRVQIPTGRITSGMAIPENSIETILLDDHGESQLRSTDDHLRNTEEFMMLTGTRGRTTLNNTAMTNTVQTGTNGGGGSALTRTISPTDTMIVGLLAPIANGPCNPESDERRTSGEQEMPINGDRPASRQDPLQISNEFGVNVKKVLNYNSAQKEKKKRKILFYSGRP